VGAHDDVDAVDLNERGAREDAPQQTAVDGSARRRIGEALRGERDAPRLFQREIGAQGVPSGGRGERDGGEAASW
jgi:hypothetical protein